MIYCKINEEQIVSGFYTIKRHGQAKCDEVLKNGGIIIKPPIWSSISKWYKAKFVGVVKESNDYNLDDFEEIKKEIIPSPVEKTPIEILEEKVLALTEENNNLKKMDSDLVSLSWDMDYRVCEIEWTLESVLSPTDNSPTTFSINNIFKGGNYKMALSRFEQAKIIILSGDYDRSKLEMQLGNYLKRNYITQEEYDTLISMMDANEIIAK